ncbi:hypothetical protein Btru_051378 [Bulinus truncatus]|nr:hypothetical protein Btru_051378 [Bulinus truncatus]
MRVVFKYFHQLEIVENVSVDDKCFPLVAGIHPFLTTSPDQSPLYREAALWFKTLVIETVYIDCDKKVIFWLPVLNDVDPEVVSLRRSAPTESGAEDFIPPNAKPLFEDSSHYEFDASLKDMMSKCLNNVRNFIKRKISTEDFNKNVAHILHVYILKSVIFGEEHLYSLNRAKSLIEERLKKAEQRIIEVADNMDKLNKCLYAVMGSILQQENLESEQYLRTCDREFLSVFLHKTEEELERQNLSLEAEQSKVNWAKSNEEEGWKIEELQEKRNKLFKEIEKLIKVREAIKNVISRKEKTRRKVKNSGTVQNCFHNIFKEINRRISVETAALDRLCNDKVNISAAREATVGAIIELSSSNRDSNRDTKFDPDDCVDYLNNGEMIEKPYKWLTFREKVSLVLENTASEPFNIHKRGCEALRDQINLALSEYSLALRPDKPDWAGVLVPGHQSTVNEMTDTSKYISISLSKKNSVKPVFESLVGAPNTDTHSFENPLCSDDVQLRKNNVPLSSKSPAVAADDRSSVYCPSQNDNLLVQLALKALMKQIDNIKGAMQALFCDVVEILAQHHCRETVDSLPDQAELLWKSYERSFCQEMLNDLNKLYYTGLQVGIHSAYQALSKEPLSEVLKGDKILDLFFGSKRESMISSSTLPSVQEESDKISMAKSVSLLSLDIRHCDINDLYKLANDDSYNMTKQITTLDSHDENDDITADSSSSLSSEASNETDVSPKSETDTKPDSGIQEESELFTLEDAGNLPGLTENWSSLSHPGKIAEALDPVLTPFRRYMKKCLDANCFLDKVRYITKAIEDLNRDISRLYGPDHQSACDDIITMLVLALCNMSEDVFVGLYIDLRLLMDILPPFLSGTLYDYNLVSLFAAYDFLFSRNVCNSVIRKYPGSFKRKSERRPFD